MVHILLKPGLENFERYFPSINYTAVLKIPFSLCLLIEICIQIVITTVFMIVEPLSTLI